MAYIPNTDYYMGNTGETEEERRRREEEEAAQRAAESGGVRPQDVVYGGGTEPAAPSAFEQALNRRMSGVGQRVDNAMNQFSNPGQALIDRVGQPSEDAANTEVQSQQVKTYADGSQEHVVKTQVPAPVSPADLAQAAPEPAPQSMAAATVMSDQQRQAAVQRLQAAQAQQTQAAPQAAAAPMAPVAPVAPAAAAAPAAVAAPVAPETAQLPPGMIGAPTQLAGPMVPGVVPAAPMAAAAPTPEAVASGAEAMAAAPEAAWIKEANAANGDFNKMLDIAARYPESRKAIQDQLKTGFQKQTMSDEAQKILEAAGKGDPKALNKLELALRPDSGRKKTEEVTTKDYLQAYLYKRLGLDELAANAQQKILGQGTKFGQIQLDGSNWTAEYDRNTGELVRAKDDEGNVATQNTLNKLSAASMKLGTHVYAFTGEPSIVHEKDGTMAEVRQRTNAITGAIENVYVTGPKAGEKYSGTEVPMAKSVLTSAAKMDYGVISGYRKAFGEDLIKAMDQARKDGVIKSPEDQAAFLDKWKFSSGMPGVGAPGAAAAPAAAAGTVAAPAAVAAQPAAAATTTEAQPAAAAAAGQVVPLPAPPVRGANESETGFKLRQEQWTKDYASAVAINQAAKVGNIELGNTIAKIDYEVVSKYRGKWGEDILGAMDQARRDGLIKGPADQAAFLEKWGFKGGMSGLGAPGSTPAVGGAPAAAVGGAAAAAVGGAPAAAVGGAAAPPAVDAAAVARAQGDLAAIDREIKRVPPKEVERLRILTTERAAIQQRIAQAGGGAAATSGGGAPVDMTTPVAGAEPQRGANEGEDQFKRRYDTWKTQQAQKMEVGTAEQKDFVTYKGVVQDKAESGRDVARVTRGQVKDLMADPVIIGIMNGSGTQYAAAGKLIREMAAGAYSDDDNGKRLADDIRGLSLTQPQKDALSRYAQANTSINRATLKANSGAGSISNAEQTANKAANMNNIGDLTPFAALTGLSRRSYLGDLTQEKAAMLAASKYITRDQFDQAWQKTEDQRVKQYEGIYRARLELIKPFADKANANPNDAQAQQRYRDAAIHSFRVYPTPEYTAGVGWTFPTKESKRAAMAAAAGDR